MELKYRQGNLSRNALLDAEDELTEAKDAVETARRNLFTAYRTYYWAVNYGVMSSGQSSRPWRAEWSRDSRSSSPSPSSQAKEMGDR